MSGSGQIVILNGASRAGKTTIARAVQENLTGIWMNLGMDNHIAATPSSHRPGVGLRPGIAQVPIEIEEAVPILYAALYDSVAAHARHGLNVVVDVKHHDSYSKPRHILRACASRLKGFPVLFVGVRCPLDVIWARRETTWGHNRDTATDDVIAAVELSEAVCHAHDVDYDLELDTSRSSPHECARRIEVALAHPPASSAFDKLMTQNPSS